jgi:Phosphodiester glycosidase/SPOR domain
MMRIALVALLVLTMAAPARAHDRLPLGPRDLPEARTTTAVAPGVTHTRIVRGRPSSSDAWTVDVAVLADREAARDLAARLEAAGFPAAVTALERAPDDPARGPLGHRVRSGAFATQAEADAHRAALTAAGFTGGRTVSTAEDGTPTTGPWVVNVLSVDPRRAEVEPAIATDILPGRELLTALAARTGAAAALNGGYFVIGEANGTDGDLAGISVRDGDRLSEAVDGRTSLVLGRGAPFVSALSDAAAVTAPDASRRPLDGLNRAPGLIRGCGGTGDTPTDAPKHDFTCTDPGELILFTPAFGTATPAGPGAEAVLDADGRVTELRTARGGAIAPDGEVLSATGDAADWLRAHALIGRRLDVAELVWSEHGRLALRPGTGVVNGGPRLVHRGHEAITAFAEGFHWPEDPGFYYRFGVRRNPRTLAGVTPWGRLLLVTVDGRRPGTSVGASFEESAAILRALGAREGVNLDGGGSTAMTIGARLVTVPSDATGERPIADALVVNSARRG